MQSQAYLHNLAAELRERILLEISAPRDLLHLALTCKALCVQIIPHHLQFRVLRVTLARCEAEEILNILSKQPRYIISRFRTVEILNLEKDVLESIPFCLLPPKGNDLGRFTATRSRKTTHEFFSLTISIIAKMSNLVNLTFTSVTYHFQSILRILSTSTPSLAFLDVHNAYFGDIEDDSESQEEFNYGSPPWSPLQNLKELRISSFFDVHPMYVKELAHLTPNLSRFELHLRLYNLDSLHAFWEWATWPRLTAMLTYFEGFDGSDTLEVDEDIRMTAALTDFLKRHVGIIHFGLHLKTDIFQLAEPLDKDVLPNLRKLATNIPLHMIVSSSLASNITHLCCVFYDEPVELLNSMTNLTECVAHLQYTHVHEFFEIAPKSLQKLIIDMYDEYIDRYSGEDLYETEIPGLESLRTLHKLTHLAGILGLPRTEYLDDYSISAAFCRELAVLPALTHVGPALNEDLLPRADNRYWSRFKNGRIDGATPGVAAFFRKDGILENMIDWTNVEDIEVEDEDEAKDNGDEEDGIIGE